jgi:acyl carrier protein
MNDLERKLRDALAELLQLDPDHMSTTVSFDEFGVDSLIGLRFARKVQDLTGRYVDAEWLFDYPTLSRFAAFLASQSPYGAAA